MEWRSVTVRWAVLGGNGLAGQTKPLEERAISHRNVFSRARPFS